MEFLNLYSVPVCIIFFYTSAMLFSELALYNESWNQKYNTYFVVGIFVCLFLWGSFDFSLLIFGVVCH